MWPCRAAQEARQDWPTAASSPLSWESQEGSQGPGAGQAQRTLILGGLWIGKGRWPPQPAGHTLGMPAPDSLPSPGNHLRGVCLAGSALSQGLGAWVGGVGETQTHQGIPGGPVVENPPGNAGDTGLIRE